MNEKSCDVCGVLLTFCAPRTDPVPGRARAQRIVDRSDRFVCGLSLSSALQKRVKLSPYGARIMSDYKHGTPPDRGPPIFFKVTSCLRCMYCTCVDTWCPSPHSSSTDRITDRKRVQRRGHY